MLHQKNRFATAFLFLSGTIKASMAEGERIMKRIITILLAILMCPMLFACESEEYDYEGRYVLIRNENSTSLVTVWDYPDDEMIVEYSEVDLTNLESYISDDYLGNGPGPVLNNLLGTLGYNRKFFQIQPIGIQESDIDIIIRKNIAIYLSVTLKDGNTYRIKLKYDETIHA